MGQTSANDLNANVKYPTLDGRIEDTYAKRSTATNKNSLYDSYIRAFRWATDRIGDAGVVGFVSNGGWIDGNTADGIRLSLADDYSAVYVYNLRGNQRTAGELSRKEGGKVFGAGSRNTVAVFVGVKGADRSGPCDVFYHDIGDYLSREDKLRIVDETQFDAVDWKTITPNEHGDWVNQRDDAYGSWPVIGDKKPAPGSVTIFTTLSRGLETARDAWVYNYSRQELKANVSRLVTNYNDQLEPFDSYCQAQGVTRRDEKAVTAYLAQNPHAADETRIKWSATLKQHLARGTVSAYSGEEVRRGCYRPFDVEHVYFGPMLNHRRGELAQMFPTPHHKNIGFLVLAPRDGTQFATLATDLLPDLSFFTYTAQFFPRWTYKKVESTDGELALHNSSGDVDEYGYRRVDNITDGILALYREAIGDQVTKDDIFYYVYGLLHDPAYRTGVCCTDW